MTSTTIDERGAASEQVFLSAAGLFFLVSTAMAVIVTVAITLERLAPAGELLSRMIGVIALVSGMLLLLKAVATV